MEEIILHINSNYLLNQFESLILSLNQSVLLHILCIDK